MNKRLLVILFIGFLVIGCVKTITESKPILGQKKQNQEKLDIIQPIPIERTNYVVIVKENSLFKDEAKRFANSKNASLLMYSQNFNELMTELKNKNQYLLLSLLLQKNLIQIL